MGFLYLRRRVAGWMVLVFRLALVFFGPGLGVEVHPSLGLLAMVVFWAVPPAILAYLVSRLEPAASEPEARDSIRADLESSGWFGVSGLGWISSGHRAIGVTVLVVRFVILGAGVVFGPLFFLAAADSCVDDGDACAALQWGVWLGALFWLALWLAFPVVSAALLRRATSLGAEGLRLAVPRALVWIALGLLALFTVPTMLGWLLSR